MENQNQVHNLHVGYHCSKYLNSHKNFLPVNLSRAIVAYEDRLTDLVEAVLS